MEYAAEQATDRHRILVVDDELGIVNAVRRELALPPFGRYRYEVDTSTDPVEALTRAAQQNYEVVISDYRMPQMSGFEFLQRFARLQPDCVPIVLSGQTDMAALVRMINETHVYRFIPKPWTTYFLKSSLAQAVAFRQENVNNRRWAQTLREHGVALPAGAINPVDHILVVDDDLSVANAVARCLTQRDQVDELLRIVRHGAGGQAGELDPASLSVQISDSPLHALKMADAVTFSCVIADYRMPDMDGTRFLTEFSEKQPECACILFSGVASMDGIITALDLAHIHAFIAKPWIDFELRATVAEALVRRRLLLENKLLAQLCHERGLAV